ncbi:MAG: tRNA pseudouridine(55) synthase TruB [Vicinamibacterales bacterium]
MDGVLVVDKPEGLTSHDVVAVARRALREKRIGHTGTLDPLATGVLPLACGKATRLVRFLSASDKDYEATIRFGLTTDTYDITGTETGRVPGPIRRAEVEAALETLKGEYLQTPPPYSAKKVEGVRAYALARRAQPVALKAVPVHVSALTLLDLDEERAVVRLTCSAGFYVRSFAHALGQAVGTGACLEALRRTRSGDFTVEAAMTLDELQADPEAAAGWVLPLEGLLPRFPAVTVTDEGRLRASHGRELLPGHYSGRPEGWTRILDAEGRLLGLGQPGTHADSLHPEVVLT